MTFSKFNSQCVTEQYHMHHLLYIDVNAQNTEKKNKNKQLENNKEIKRKRVTECDE